MGAFDQRCADFLADEVSVLIKRRVIDERSPAADALLDYRDPPRTERSDRLATLEAELRKLREENTRLKTALTGLLRYHDKCGMESSYGVYAREVLATLPKPPEAKEDDEAARRLDQADMPGGFP